MTTCNYTVNYLRHAVINRHGGVTRTLIRQTIKMGYLRRYDAECALLAMCISSIFLHTFLSQKGILSLVLALYTESGKLTGLIDQIVQRCDTSHLNG